MTVFSGSLVYRVFFNIYHPMFLLGVYFVHIRSRHQNKQDVNA